MYYIIKIVSSALLITLISEIAKRNSFWGAVLASLPFISIIAFIFLYIDSKDVVKVQELSISIFWLVIPSLVLFIALPALLKRGISFYPSLGLACIATIICYYLMSLGMKKFGLM